MLPEELTKFIGQGRDVKVFDVEKGAIKKFADAVDDPNPLYWDEDYARNSIYRSIIAPPGFFGWPASYVPGSTFIQNAESRGVTEPSEVRESLSDALEKAGFGRGLDGGMDYEFFAPIRAGDTLIGSAVIKDIIEREGRTGKLLFVIRETTYTNQNGQFVAKTFSTSIYR